MYRLIVDKMEQYLDAKVKRYVQAQMFLDKVTNCFLGLSGPHPEEYLTVTPKAESTLLVDINPPKESKVKVLKTDLRTGYEVLARYSDAPKIVDCDFCKTVKSCGNDFVYLYKRMKENKGDSIAFTFSVRNAGVQYTLDYLKEHIPEFDYTGKWESIDLPFYKTRQFIRKMKGCPIYMYRDSGAIMLSGIIKIESK